MTRDGDRRARPAEPAPEGDDSLESRREPPLSDRPQSGLGRRPRRDAPGVEPEDGARVSFDRGDPEGASADRALPPEPGAPTPPRAGMMLADDARVAPPPRTAPDEAYATAPPPAFAPPTPQSARRARAAAAAAAEQAAGGADGDAERQDPPTEPKGPRPAAPSLMIVMLAAAVGLYLLVALSHALLHAATEAKAIAFGVALGAVGLLALASQIRWAHGVYLILPLSFAAQVAWAQWLNPQPFGEFEQLWRETLRFGASLGSGAPDLETLYRSASPSTVTLYGLAVAAFGDSLEALRYVSALLWTLQTWLVWKIAREVSELRDRAFAAAFAFGVSPALLVFGGLPSVEAVFGVFALGAIYLLLSHRRRGLAPSAAQSGLLAALAYLSRPAALAYAIGLLVILVVGLIRARSWRPRGLMLMALVAGGVGFTVGVLPQAALNYTQGGVVSIAPGPAIGYQLLVGTNRDDESGYSAEDMAAVGFEGPTPAPLHVADQQARALAWERVTADPIGFAIFAVTEKMRRLWGSERELLDWSVGSPEAAQRYSESGLDRWIPPLIDGVYLAVLLAAALGAWRLVLRRGAVRDSTRWVLLTFSFLSLAAAHMLFEVREPHHLTFTPLLVLLAPLAFIRLPQTVAAARREAEAVERQAEAEAAERREAAAAAAAALHAKLAAAQTASATAVRGADAAAATPADMAEKPAADRLAYALARMSKPPRPKKDDQET